MEQKDILSRVKGYYEQAVGSSAWQTWVKEAREAWDFYDGEQWTKSEKETLAENGQPAIVINKLASKVDNIAGTEVAGRTRIIYQSRSGEARESETARVLSDLALYVAERNDQALEISSVFKAGLVSGIGWLDVGVDSEAEGPFVFNRAEDELAIIWDPASRRADMGDMRFVCRERWLGEDDMGQLFGEKGKEVWKTLQGGAGLGGMWSPGREGVAYFDAGREMARVVEVQYFDTATQWRLRFADGSEQVCWDKKDVKRWQGLRPGTSVEEVREAPRAFVAYFAGDVLLSHSAIGYAHGGLTLIPYVYKRHKADGRPYGLVRSALDPQRELNKRRSKAMHLLNTAQVIADVDAVDDPNILAREAARPDGMILKRAGKDLRILRNTDLAVSQVQVMESASKDIQEVMGVFDESLGRESNAVSGVAIEQRQMAGSLSQMFAFDGLRRTKKRLGEQILGLIRQYFTHEMVVRVTDDMQSVRVVGLNVLMRDLAGEVVRGEDGEPLRVNDPKVGMFDVVVEEVRDVMSARQREAQQLEVLVKAGIPVPPKVLVEMSGVRNKQEILQALEQGGK